MGGRLRKRLLFSCLRVGRRLELGYELGQVRSSCGHAIINARRLRYREASFLPGLLSARLPDGGDSHHMVVVDCFNTIFRISRSSPGKKKAIVARPQSAGAFLLSTEGLYMRIRKLDAAAGLWNEGQIVMYTYDYDASICLAIVYDMVAIINRTYRIQKVYRHL